MTNTKLLAFAFLNGVNEAYSHPILFWNQFSDLDRDQHQNTARMFLANPDVAPAETHQA